MGSYFGLDSVLLTSGSNFSNNDGGGTDRLCTPQVPNFSDVCLVVGGNIYWWDTYLHWELISRTSWKTRQAPLWCVYIAESIPFHLPVSVVFLSPHVQMCSSFSVSDLGNKHPSSVACFECSCFVCLMRPFRMYELCHVIYSFDQIQIHVVDTQCAVLQSVETQTSFSWWSSGFIHCVVDVFRRFAVSCCLH